jgi:hypothetical protein
MICQILKLDIYIISLEPESERCKNLINSLVLNGFSREKIYIAPGVKCADPIQGVSLAHIRALLKAVSTTGQGSHFMILEEDAVINENNVFQDTYLLPNDAELFYLGWGKKRYSQEKHKWDIGDYYPFNIETRMEDVIDVGNSIFKVHSFLCTHAIVYLNNEVVHDVIESIFKCMETGNQIPHDMAMACLQKQVPTYAPQFTQFIQVETRPEKQYINDEMPNSIFETIE